MLYKLNLTSLKSFAQLLEKAEITINYRPYSNFIDILSDTEVLIARNQKDILNITSLVNSINKIEENDMIWIRHDDKYVLAIVESKMSKDPDNAKIHMPLSIYYSDNTPKVIKEIFNDIKFSLIDDENIIYVTNKILELLMKKDKKACEMEFIKGKGELVEVCNISREITPYESSINFIKEPKKKHCKKTYHNPNRGEIIIELDPPEEKGTIKFENLPAKKSEKPEIQDTREFCKSIMKKQVQFYMELQKKTMENFLEMEEQLWDKFFDIMD